MGSIIDASNAVLQSFAPSTTIERQHGGFYVRWRTTRREHCRRWQTRGQDFYPTWHGQWGHGGAACTALSQLIRWCRHRPVFGISVWRHWASERCKLLPMDAVDLLLAEGYPANQVCVLCDAEITGSLDWWSLGSVSGPCCGMRSGCRQTGIPEFIVEVSR